MIDRIFSTDTVQVLRNHHGHTWGRRLKLLLFLKCWLMNYVCTGTMAGRIGKYVFISVAEKPDFGGSDQKIGFVIFKKSLGNSKFCVLFYVKLK